MLKRISAAFLFLVLTIPCWAQGQQAKPATVLQKLEADYQSALAEYYKPYQSAKTDEERRQIKLDPAKDPSPAYLKKFRSLAEKSGKDQQGFTAWQMTMQVAQQAGDEKAAESAADAIIAKFGDTTFMAQFASMLPYSFFSLPPDQRQAKISGMLQKIQDTAKSDDVRAAAEYSRAQLIGQGRNGDSEAAAKIYQDVVDKYPNTPQGKRAKGDIYEMQNLVPGKTAPDFEAEDQDGVKFKLSDYRGKVVVLDFWGFW